MIKHTKIVSKVEIDEGITGGNDVIYEDSNIQITSKNDILSLTRKNSTASIIITYGSISCVLSEKTTELFPGETITVTTQISDNIKVIDKFVYG